MIKTIMKKINEANIELKVLNYFRTVVKHAQEYFKKEYGALNPVEKYKVYAFIAQRDKGLAQDICRIMQKKTVSYKIGG
jgi:hypothetical protein